MKILRVAFLFCLLCISQTVNSQSSAYVLSPKVDYSIGGGVLLLGTSGYFAGSRDTALTQDQIDALNVEDIPRFDRKAVGKWSPALSHISDAGLLLCVASPAFLLFSDEVRKNAAPFGVITAETYLSTIVLTNFTKNISRRARPYVYHPDVPSDLKMKKDAKRSFFSGHTSLAFCSAVATSTMFCRYHPDSPLRPWIWGTTLTLASATGYLRYAAGKHFPSDVIVGAIAGSLVGYAIPLLHQNRGDKSAPDKAFTVRIIFAF